MVLLLHDPFHDLFIYIMLTFLSFAIYLFFYRLINLYNWTDWINLFENKLQTMSVTSAVNVLVCVRRPCVCLLSVCC